jgi:hypothetical protein
VPLDGKTLDDLGDAAAGVGIGRERFEAMLRSA